MNNLSSGAEIEVSFTNHDWKLGFSITLGYGSQKVRGDDGIYINSIEEGSPIAIDGRIWVGDQITAVRNSLDGERINLNGLDYETSVTILKKACRSRRLVIIVRKCEVNLTNLENSHCLGFLVAGGIDNEFIPGDGRIYITKLIPGCKAALDGRLSVGDRLLGIRHNYNSDSIHSDNFLLFDFCTNQEIVSALKSALKRGFVSLMVCKNDDLDFNPKVRFGNTNFSMKSCKDNVFPRQNKLTDKMCTTDHIIDQKAITIIH